MSFVLVIVSCLSGPTNGCWPAFQEFSSRERCEAVKEFLMPRKTPHPKGIAAICYEK